jgi:hypothetical protein
MFVLCLLYKDGSIERKSDIKDEKDLNSTKMDQRGKTPERQKKSHRRQVYLSFVGVVCCQVQVSATG